MFDDFGYQNWGDYDDYDDFGFGLYGFNDDDDDKDDTFFSCLGSRFHTDNFNKNSAIQDDDCDCGYPSRKIGGKHVVDTLVHLNVMHAEIDGLVDIVGKEKHKNVGNVVRKTIQSRRNSFKAEEEVAVVHMILQDVASVVNLVTIAVEHIIDVTKSIPSYNLDRLGGLGWTKTFFRHHHIQTIFKPQVFKHLFRSIGHNVCTMIDV